MVTEAWIKGLQSFLFSVISVMWSRIAVMWLQCQVKTLLWLDVSLADSHMSKCVLYTGSVSHLTGGETTKCKSHYLPTLKHTWHVLLFLQGISCFCAAFCRPGRFSQSNSPLPELAVETETVLSRSLGTEMTSDALRFFGPFSLSLWWVTLVI